MYSSDCFSDNLKKLTFKECIEFASELNKEVSNINVDEVTTLRNVDVHLVQILPITIRLTHLIKCLQI